MGTRRYLGVDHGLKRVGIAISDELGLLARPLKTLDYSRKVYDEIAEIVEREQIATVVVGIPVDLDGSETLSTRRARNFRDRLASRLEIPVEMWDEALSSRRATEKMVEAGTGRGRRKKKGEIDRWAAAVILQEWLDTHQT